MRWTEEQWKAIRARNHTILVGAAAGSGKTAVLVERIVQLVREQYRLNRMLIVTFTRAAAGEMRARLGQRLCREAQEEPEVFGQALDDLEQTDISTIHAFCQRVLRQEFQNVGIDPMARVCEEQQRKMLFEQAFREAMNELLDAGENQEFLYLTRCFHQQVLLDMCERLYAFVCSMPDPFVWLHEKNQMVGRPLREHPWWGILEDSAKMQLQGLPCCLEMQRGMLGEMDAVDAFREVLQKDEVLVQGLLQVCAENPEQLPNALAGVSFGRAPVCRGLTDEQKAWKDRYNDLRNDMKETVKGCAALLLRDENAATDDLQVVQRELLGLEALLERVHVHFSEAKNRENVLDFSDLEQMTLAVLRQEGCRAQLQEQYDHIFVDECQDVSAVQDAILQSLHGEANCLFMVGDVKQSIYRFRLADPTLFLQRMRSFSDDEDADERRIFLQRNFRSRGAVLDAANRVFRRAMTRSVTELDYLPQDELVQGRETENDPWVEIRLVNQPEGRGSGESCLESEAAVVARRIRELLETDFDDGAGGRKYQYRDMVILLQKKAGVGARLAELLEAKGIPVYFDGTDQYYDLPEVRTVKALLEVIDNPCQDLPLLTALKNLPFCLTDGQLADIRMAKSGRDVPFYRAFVACGEGEGELAEKCREILKKLREWRFVEENSRLSDFVWRLMEESGLYAVCGAYPEGELRQANLRLLRQKAADFERNQSGGLSGFLRMIDLQMKMGDSTGAKVLGEKENLVRMMTMHKSKGLEFPVVFCMRLTAGMMGAAPGALRMHSRLGVCLPCVREELNIKRGSIGEDAFDYQRRLDELAERCRLLYVAMTRAREVLVLTGCSEQTGDQVWRMPVGPYRVWKAQCMMDWVMQAVMDDAADPTAPWQVIWEESAEWHTQEREDRREELAEWLQVVLAQPANVSDWPWWERQVEPAAAPLKTSVSSLTRQQVLGDRLPLVETEEDMPDKRVAEEIVMPLRLSELAARPQFMEEKRVTGAERGTLTHRFLSLADLKKLKGCHGAALRSAIDEEGARLQEIGCFAGGELDMISLGDAAAFFESTLGQRLLAAQEIHREWGFNLRLDKGTLLQGVMDCAFLEDGAWVLVDYKTDHVVSEEAFVQRHQAQMEWYARALETISGRRVKEKWLYALGLGKAFCV